MPETVEVGVGVGHGDLKREKEERERERDERASASEEKRENKKKGWRGQRNHTGDPSGSMALCDESLMSGCLEIISSMARP